MLSSSRFIVAIHALSVLARHANKGPVCSSTIATSVDTNPVVIRRLMAELEKAKLVRATAGRSGGFELERDADGITLADIYQAVEDETVFRMHKTDPEFEMPGCLPDGQNSRRAFAGRRKRVVNVAGTDNAQGSGRSGPLTSAYFKILKSPMAMLVASAGPAMRSQTPLPMA